LAYGQDGDQRKITVVVSASASWRARMRERRHSIRVFAQYFGEHSLYDLAQEVQAWRRTPTSPMMSFPAASKGRSPTTKTTAARHAKRSRNSRPRSLRIRRLVK